MILLGNLALWLAFLIGLWGAITGFVGGVQGRAGLQHSAGDASFGLFGARVAAGTTLRRPAVPAPLAPPRDLPPRLHPRVRRAPHEPQPADVLSVVGAVRGAEGQPAVLGHGAESVRGAGAEI